MSPVLPGPEPEMTVLAKASSNSPETRKEESLTVSVTRPQPTAPAAQYPSTVSTEWALQDHLVEFIYSHYQVMLVIQVNFRDSLIYIQPSPVVGNLFLFLGSAIFSSFAPVQDS
jgi:hypothetical protein